MRCPNCRCEIGSQPTCPYCGIEIPAPEPKPVVTRYAEPAAPTTVSAATLQNVLGRMNRHLSNVDIRTKLSLVLLSGIFILLILLIIVLIIK